MHEVTLDVNAMALLRSIDKRLQSVDEKLLLLGKVCERLAFPLWTVTADESTPAIVSVDLGPMGKFERRESPPPKRDPGPGRRL